MTNYKYNKMYRLVKEIEEIKAKQEADRLERERKETEAKVEAENEQNKNDTIMRNIECYDGTSNGQRDVPKG